VRDRAGGRCKEAGGEFLALKYATPLQAVKALAQDGTRVGDEGGGGGGGGSEGGEGYGGESGLFEEGQGDGDSAEKLWIGG